MTKSQPQSVHATSLACYIGASVAFGAIVGATFLARKHALRNSCGQPKQNPTLRVALIGHGAIGSIVARALVEGTHGLDPRRVKLVSVLVQRERERPPAHLDSVLLTTTVESFFGADWDLCIEAAGQELVRTHADRCLRMGRSFLVTSIGALTSDRLFSALIAAAASPGGGRLLLASGAMPGLDWMHSSALVTDASTRVKVTQTKPPESWKGARYKPGTTEPLPDEHDYDALSAPVTVFEGSARDAGSYFPKNSNICAMLAIATAGLDATVVKLIADPTSCQITSKIEYRGAAGDISFNVVGRKSPGNPRTSAIVPLSVIKAIKNLSGAVGIGI